MIVAATSKVLVSMMVLHTQSVNELMDVARAAKVVMVRERACEIQRRDHIAPTFCYLESAANHKELDSLCRRWSAKAMRLPKTDRFTSKSCKDAIEHRAKDLAYVAQVNGQRDALR